MRKIGYVRVSSVEQNPARQYQQLKEMGMDRIYEERLSGATQKRPELQNMLEDLEAGDTISVTDLTRITRSTRDLFELVDDIKQKEGKYLGRGKKYHSKHDGMNYAVQLYKEGNMAVKKFAVSRMCRDQPCTGDLIRKVSHIIKKGFPMWPLNLRIVSASLIELDYFFPSFT